MQDIYMYMYLQFHEWILTIFQPPPKAVENSGPGTPEDEEDEVPPPPIAARPDKTKSIVS